MEQKKEMYDCPDCGKIVQKVSKYYHMKSKHHQKCLEFLDKFTPLEQFQIDNMVSLKCI
jgi:hypothetical protein